MISDNDLYRLAIFLGSASVVLIVIYHFLEINTQDSALQTKAAKARQAQQPRAVVKS